MDSQLAPTGPLHGAQRACYAVHGMNDLLLGLLGALVATNPPAAVSNMVLKKTGLAITVPATNDPLEKEFQQLMADDDAAQAEVDDWIKNDNRFAEKVAAIAPERLRLRSKHAFERVKKPT